MFNFSQIFPSTKKPNRRVRAKRSMVMRLASGETTTVAAGDEFEITHDEASKLDSGDVVFLDPINKPEPPKIEPAPERPEPRPAPEAWAKLPACFTEWHNLNERFRVALEHGRLIVEKRVEIFGTTTSIGDPEGSAATLLVLRMKPFERGGGTVFTNKIRLDDEQVRLQDAALNSAAKKAADHLEELRRDYTLKLQKLHLQCGWERLSTADQATKLARQVRQIGIDLFSMRVAALELHPGQVARLYAGSALHQKYGSVEDANVRRTCSAGYDESGELRTFIDDSVDAIAGFALRDLAAISNLTPLLDQGRKELAKAKKAAA